MRSLSTRAAGLLILVGGIWGGLIPFVGPYFHFALGPDKSWTWSSGRLYLDVLPGIAAVIGGLMLLGSGPRAGGKLGALLALAAGIWFAIGPDLSFLWNAAGAQGTPHGTRGVRVLELLSYHTGLGVVITALAAYALPGFAGRRRAVVAPATEAAAAPVAAEPVAARELDRRGEPVADRPVDRAPSPSSIVPGNPSPSASWTVRPSQLALLSASRPQSRCGHAGVAAACFRGCAVADGAAHPPSSQDFVAISSAPLTRRLAGRERLGHMSDLLAIVGSGEDEDELLKEIARSHADRVTVLVEDGSSDWGTDDSAPSRALRDRLAALINGIEQRTGAVVVGLAGSREQLRGWRFDRVVGGRTALPA